MGALGFGFKAMKGSFFDAEKIADDAKRFDRKVKSKFGAFTRRTMKNSIQYADGISAPGKPPFAHRQKGFGRVKVNKKTGVSTHQQLSPLRELIFFALDESTDSVVIGPVEFGKGVADVIEQGGTTTYTDPRTGLKKSGSRRPHPFAEPAGEAEAAKFPDLIRNMVK
jgi:hypothetical protein